MSGDATTDATDGGLLGRFLVDPGAVMREAADAVITAAAHLLPWAAAAAGLLAVVTLALSVARARHRRTSAARATAVEVLAPPEPDAGSAATVWAHLHEAFGHGRALPWQSRPRLAWEYIWREDGMRIRLWVPPSISTALVARAVESAWPGARTTLLDPAPLPLPEGWRTVAGELRLSAPGWFPLATDMQPDPLRSVLGAGACGPRQAAAVQIVLRPLGRRAMRKGRRAARELRHGQSTGLVARALGLLVSSPPRSAVRSDPAVSPDVRSVLGKVEQPLWHAAVRYAAADSQGGSARAVRGRAHGLASAFGVYGARNHFLRRRLRRGRRVLDERRLGRRGVLLSTAEVAALAHVPLDSIVPELSRAGARSVAPSPALARVAPDGWLLGMSDAGEPRPVVLRKEDARFHMHLMGATGSGKSTLIVNLALQDVAHRRGAVVIDPNGDLVRDIYGALDEEARARTVLLDQQAPGPVPTLNMLEVPRGLTPDLVVDHLVGTLSRIFESSWGPRIEDILRSACLTLLRRPGATLSDIPRILTIPGEYQKYLSTGPEDDLRGFWAWYEAQSVGVKAQVTGPLLYKLRAFLLRPFVKKIVNAPRSSIDMGALLDGGGLLLARLPKGLLGEDTSKLLGSFLVSKAWQAATARAALDLEARRDATLYVDECQNYLSLPRSFDEVLAEARKYRLSLVLAHQNLAQLPRSLAEAISANARNKLYFQLSAEDARVLSRHMAPNLTEHDLRNLGAFQGAARLMANAHEQPACTVTTLPRSEPPAPHPPMEVAA